MARFAPVVVVLLAAGCRTVTPAWSIAAPSDETRRTTTAGEVVGGAGRYQSLAWLGVPFAAPPVGPLRWRAPQPPAPWQGVRPALKFGRACVQPSSQILTGEEPDGEVSGDEDCLTLNLWAPPKADHLPVMVWIHGGGNSLGSAASYDLGHLATGQQVLAISVQYRLGPLGWLRHPALRTGDPVEDSGNFGTLDLIRALQWVRDNAAAFGGDPGNVTVFGESAGGQNVYALLLSPMAKGLFHRAIAQSPVLAKGTLDEAEHGRPSSSHEVVQRLLQRDGVAAPATAAYLRGKSAGDVLRAYLDHSAGGGLKMLDMPMVFPDGAVLPSVPWLEAFARPDGWNQVPVVIGTNREEAKLFLFWNPAFTWKLFGVLPRMRDPEKYEASAEVMSRLWKARSIDAVAEAMIGAGATAVYAYRFDWARQGARLGTDLSKLLGAAHAMEIPFVHGHFDGPLAQLMAGSDPAGRDALSAAMMAHWGQFARTGQPGAGWAPYDPTDGAPKFLTFDAEPPGVRMGNSVERAPQVVGDLLADPRIPDRAAKCEGLRGLVPLGLLAPELMASSCP